MEGVQVVLQLHNLIPIVLVLTRLFFSLSVGLKLLPDLVVLLGEDIVLLHQFVITVFPQVFITVVTCYVTFLVIILFLLLVLVLVVVASAFFQYLGADAFDCLLVLFQDVDDFFPDSVALVHELSIPASELVPPLFIVD